MKIGLLTLPLHTNYGGLLQAYALQTYLKQLGHEVVFIDRQSDRMSFVQQIMNFARIYFLGRSVLKRRNKLVVMRYTQKFIDEYITPKTEVITSDKALKRIVRRYNIDAVVVGSDQVWRSVYAGKRIGNYFLDFMHEPNVRRIAYAASFGTDKWEESRFVSTDKLAALLQRFDAISVREDSGVDICKDAFSVKAEHQVDPTMLLTADAYTPLIEQTCSDRELGGMYVYLIDRTEEQLQLITSISKQTGLKPNIISCKSEYNNVTKSLPSVGEWLQGFKSAELVVTDSFHGTIFSILFNKPFWVTGNRRAGIARFESLLAMFGLSHRLLDSNMTVDYSAPINFESVNNRLSAQRERARRFFSKHLQIGSNPSI